MSLPADLLQMETSEQLVRRFAEAVGDGEGHVIYRLDLIRGCYDYISSAAEQITGLSAAELRQDGALVRLAEHVHPADYQRVLDAMGAAASQMPDGVARLRLEYRVRNQAGQWLWFDDSMAVHTDAQGRAAYAVGVAIDVTRLKRAELSLQESEAKFHTTLDASFAGFFVHQELAFRYVNPALARMFGYQAEELVGKLGPVDLIAPERHVQLREHIARREAGEESCSYETLGRRKDGSTFPVIIWAKRLMYEGRPASAGTVVDISERKAAEEALQAANAQLEMMALVFRHSQEAIIITDAEARIVSVNAAFERINGYRAEEVLGKNPHLLSSGRQDQAFYAAMWQALFQNGYWEGEVWNRRKDGAAYPAWLRVSAVRDAQGNIHNYIGIVADVTERHEAEERIRQLAYFDPLTRLANRSLLQDRVCQALAQAERDKYQVALLFVDLDRFKNINDSLGHFSGDRVLQSVAERLESCLRWADTVARLGGDEFVVLCPEQDVDGAREVAQRLIDALARPYPLGQTELTITASIGISLFPQDGGDFETLLKHADTAMYRAKASGRNQLQFFSREMNVAALERLVLENSLRQALERQEFELVYQPQVDAGTGRIVAAEALLRWNHPQAGVIMPGRFIPVAEDSGLILSLGDWVLAEACRQLCSWQALGLSSEFRLAVNISAIQLAVSDFDQRVARILAETGVNPACLELELTESAAMADVEAGSAMLRRLQDLGVGLAIDDFGTGYSSLSYLKRFPIDKLKIDQSLIRDIVEDANDRAIAEAIISLAHVLRLPVVAEGVEKPDQLDLLSGKGCDLVQGYHFSRPVEAETFASLVWQQVFLK